MATNTTTHTRTRALCIVHRASASQSVVCHCVMPRPSARSPTARVVGVASAAAALVDVLAHAAPPDEFVPVPAGGWQFVDVNTNDIAWLVEPLKNESNYRSSVTTRVCIASIDYIYEQVFDAGANFQYHGSGCSIQRAVDSGVCPHPVVSYERCSMYDVRLFRANGPANATQVIRIAPENGAPKDRDDVFSGSRWVDSGSSGDDADQALPQLQSNRTSSSSSSSSRSRVAIVAAVDCLVLIVSCGVLLAMTL